MGTVVTAMSGRRWCAVALVIQFLLTAAIFWKLHDHTAIAASTNQPRRGAIVQRAAPDLDPSSGCDAERLHEQLKATNAKLSLALARASLPQGFSFPPRGHPAGTLLKPVRKDGFHTSDETEAYRSAPTSRSTPKHVHYHIKHCMGTNLWRLAAKNGESAPSICKQLHGECLQSYSEAADAKALLRTPHTFVSIEHALPREYPMPYVLPQNREKFFFSTLMRDPLHQLLSQLKHYGGLTEGGGYSDKCSPNDDLGPVLFHTLPDCRLVDNLALRWLSGNFVGDGGPQNDVTVEDLH